MTQTGTPAPAPTAIEYGIAEVLDQDTGELRHLPQCGSWYSDRYYTDGLTGTEAALAAAGRVAADVGGEYVVVELGRLRRTA